MGYCKPFVRGASWRSQNYGANANNGTNGPAGHSGADEACDIGTPVHAAGDGVIDYAGTFDDTYADNLLWLIDFGGNIAVLNCGDDEPTFVYAHLSRFLVKPGERVRKGQVIALSGNSGTRTTGPHCHVEAIPPGYSLNSPSLGRANPDLYLTEWPDDVTGLAAMGGAITPLEDIMADLTDKNLTDIADATLRRAAPNGAMLIEVVESFRPVMDSVIAAAVGAKSASAKDIAGALSPQLAADLLEELAARK